MIDYWVLISFVGFSLLNLFYFKDIVLNISGDELVFLVSILFFCSDCGFLLDLMFLLWIVWFISLKNILEDSVFGWFVGKENVIEFLVG